MRIIQSALAFVVCVLVLSVPERGLAQSATITYETSDLGAGRWKYTYEVINGSLTPPIEEFTIWFDLGNYRNLAIATLNPPAGTWSQLVVQSDPVLHDNGFYDALQAGGGIGVGSGLAGFSVTFDWLGAGRPGPQPFDIVDPTTLQNRYSCMTVPEPATLMLLAGLGLLYRRHRA